MKALVCAIVLLVISPSSVRLTVLQPDLVITGATTTRTCAGDSSSISVNVTVANQGTAPSSARPEVSSIVVAESALPARWTGGAGLPAIPVNGNVTIVVVLNGPPGRVALVLPIVISVNAGRWISESDYTNDTHTIAAVPALACSPVGASLRNATVTHTAIATPTPYPLAVPSFARSVMPAPANLTYTTDPGTCINHVGFGGAFVCQAIIEKSGLLLLVWDWTPCHFPTCAKAIDGFHVYALASGVRPVTVQQGGASSPIRYIGRTLLDTQTNPAVTMRGIAPFHVGECFAVTAYRGAQDSADSNTYCAGGNTLITAPWYLRTATKHPDCAALNGFGFRDCTAAVDAYHLYLEWSWTPCASSAGCARAVDGFNIYRAGGGRAAQQPDGTLFGADLGVVNPGSCFTVTAYRGGVESDQSSRFCATAASMATPLPAPMHADIDITGDSFPVETQVFIGGTVTWTNDDDDAHTVTSSDGSFGGTLEHGQKLSATFTKAGVFHYLCLYHTFMTGSIRVEAP